MRGAKTPLTPQKALEQMETICSRAEYSSGEIREKLYRKGLSTYYIDGIIESLTERRVIDDGRFARAFVHQKVNYSGWGRSKIMAALIQKRVARDLINEALDCIDMKIYMANLRHILDAKRRTFEEPDAYESRAKAFRFAAGRGYEPDLISKVLGSLSEDHLYEE